MHDSFNDLVERVRVTHKTKRADYASPNNPYSNFEEAARYAGLTVDEVFQSIIGIKLSRLHNLLASKQDPVNESVQDTKIDLAVYFLIWAAYDSDCKQPDEFLPR